MSSLVLDTLVATLSEDFGYEISHFMKKKNYVDFVNSWNSVKKKKLNEGDSARFYIFTNRSCRSYQNNLQMTKDLHMIRYFPYDFKYLSLSHLFFIPIPNLSLYPISPIFLSLSLSLSLIIISLSLSFTNLLYRYQKLNYCDILMTLVYLLALFLGFH